MKIIVAAIVLHLLGLDWLTLTLAGVWLTAAIIVNVWRDQMPEWLQ